MEYVSSPNNCPIFPMDAIQFSVGFMWSLLWECDICMCGSSDDDNINFIIIIVIIIITIIIITIVIIIMIPGT